MKKLRATRWQSLEPFVRNTAMRSVSSPFGRQRLRSGRRRLPWENAVNVLQTAFTGSLRQGLLTLPLLWRLTFALRRRQGR